MRILKVIAILPVILIEIIFACLASLPSIISGAFAIVRVWYFREYDYCVWLKRDLADCESILELGCGANSPILQIGYGRKTDAVDIWQPYVDMHKRMKNYCEIQEGDILGMEFGYKIFDAVVICDVLEHLPREEVSRFKLFEKIENAAIKKVILFTPNGFIENDEADGDPFQAHLSAWDPEDYTSRGYKVVGATGFWWLFGKSSRPKYHPYPVCEIIGMISKPIVFNKPAWARHSYAVKEVS